jgi:hypothetical protein
MNENVHFHVNDMQAQCVLKFGSNTFKLQFSQPPHPPPQKTKKKKKGCLMPKHVT